MLYECTRIKNLWLHLSGILQIDIKLKHITLGLQNISILNKKYCHCNGHVCYLFHLGKIKF